MTLTQTAILTRNAILITSLVLFFGMTGFIGYKIWYNFYYLPNLPPVEEKPDTKFGILPFPDFPKTFVSSSNFTYSLDTTTGGLPKIGDEGFEKLIKVYFILKPYATFLSPDRSQALAEKFGINLAPEILNETTYRFTEQKEYAIKTLTVNLDTGNFTYTKEATFSGEIVSDDNQLVSDFKNTLEKLAVLKTELKEGRTKVVLLKKQGDSFVETNLRTESQAVQISLWPAAIDKKSIFTPDFNKSLVSGVIKNSANDLENYLSLDFTFWPVDQTTFATYPLKAADQAFEDLKSGKGVVVLEPKKPQVSITSIYLGYYLSQNYTPYLLPIYIFEGPQFVSFVSAIDSEFQTLAK